MEREPTDDELETEIRALLPELPYKKTFVNKDDVFKDEALDDLGVVLKSHPSTRPWSRHPRSYALLRMSMPQKEEDITAEPFVCEGDLSEGISDYGIPYTHKTLPPVINERSHLSPRFLHLQTAVRSSSESMAFLGLKGSARHRVFSNPPFTSIEKLAITPGACVESVRSTTSSRVFVRKTLPRAREGGMTESEEREDRKWRITHFQHEVEVLQKLDHVHMVSFIGSYSTENHFALLFQPVAENTVHDILGSSASLSDTDTMALQSSFGCLAVGLAWLHSKSIRHKDIKPANILISNGTVLYCDFGSALDAEFKDTTQTEGIMQQRTLRYVSPETNKGEPRDEACDIWSLGCVYLEILTKLAGVSVDELLGSIHQNIQTPAHVQEVCYWMAVEGENILQEWIRQLPCTEDLLTPARWTSTMVERNPSLRTSAARLANDIQSHGHDRPDRAYVADCCVDAPVPPLKRRPSPPSTTEICPSVQTTATSVANSDVSLESPSSSEPPIPYDSPQVTPKRQPSQSPHMPPKSATELIMIEGGSHPGVPISRTQLSQGSLQVLQGRRCSDKKETEYTELRLYELRNPDIVLSTRQLAFFPEDRPSLTDAVTFWLPLADTSVEHVNEHLLVSWPDCDHLIEDFADGKTLHSRVYQRKEPNNSLLIHCESTEAAQELAYKLHTPCQEHLILQQDPIKLSSDPTESSWVLTTNGEVKHDTTHPKASHSVQFFDFSRPEQTIKGRGLLVKGCDDSTPATSRVYWLPTAMDLTLDIDSSSGAGHSKPCVTLDGLLVANYKSGVREVHHSRKDEEGICQAVEPTVCRVTWCFDFFDDRHVFLDGMSDWSLRLCMSVKSLSRKKIGRYKSYGRADLLFLVHEEKSCATIAFRLGERKRGNGQWITGCLPTSNASESYGDMEASLRLSSYFRKELLHLTAMQAVSVPDPDTGDATDPNHKKGTSETIRLGFHNEGDKIDFQHHVTQYHNCYGDARSRIHKSSISSDNHAVRASENSLSLQSTSSSSRRT